jgi:hypothetical protein
MLAVLRKAKAGVVTPASSSAKTPARARLAAMCLAPLRPSFASENFFAPLSEYDEVAEAEVPELVGSDSEAEGPADADLGSSTVPEQCHIVAISRRTKAKPWLCKARACLPGCCGEDVAGPEAGELKDVMPHGPELQPRCFRGTSGMLSTLIEKSKQSLRPLHSSNNEWEVIHAMLDSGASVTVIPPHVAGGCEIQEGAASRAGVQCEVAHGDKIPYLCEKLFIVVAEKGTVFGIRPQVADVPKALQSLRALERTGHALHHEPRNW